MGLQKFYQDDDTVVYEDTIEAKTSAGRAYERVVLVDVMSFMDDDETAALRVYLDYSAVLSDLPLDVPDFRE